MFENRFNLNDKQTNKEQDNINEVTLKEDRNVVLNEKTSGKELEKIFFKYYNYNKSKSDAKEICEGIERIVAENPNAPISLIDFIINSDASEFVKVGLLENKNIENIEEDQLKKLANTQETTVLSIWATVEINYRDYLCKCEAITKGDYFFDIKE
ncbi:MAG: hypothetical protein ACP5LP_03070 [Candidatus Micrarchaeia archaeon]